MPEMIKRVKKFLQRISRFDFINLPMGSTRNMLRKTIFPGLGNMVLNTGDAVAAHGSADPHQLFLFVGQYAHDRTSRMWFMTKGIVC
jgi:hypothetical protein